MLNLPQNPKWDIARVSHSTLVNADCFDVFPFIEDKSIDAIICDLGAVIRSVCVGGLTKLLT